MWWNRPQPIGLAAALLAAWASTLAAAPLDLERLPPALGQWYKPQSERQVWLHTMFALRRELQAVEAYAAEGDAQRLSKWSEKFADHYRSITEMVPQWQAETDPQALERLEQRARNGDFEGVLQAADALQRSCRGCHHDYQALAALRYRSPDFSRLRIQHPAGTESDYAGAMQQLSESLNRIKIAAEDGLWGRSERALNEFQTRLQGLEATCAACHRDHHPQQRIFGASIPHTLAPLREGIGKRDRPRLNRSLGSAAVEICARCHGVHRNPTALRHKLFP